ncbi:hypothetical protein LCGC14_0145680 [marine sediment metagenome]|uniref:Uncharacterized protein n=1 Tax=marine sediment metagenome TaxID=412755 RepID=A0A0F9VFA1_9ZZZZ
MIPGGKAGVNILVREQSALCNVRLRVRGDVEGWRSWFLKSVAWIFNWATKNLLEIETTNPMKTQHFSGTQTGRTRCDRPNISDTPKSRLESMAEATSFGKETDEGREDG